MYHGRNPFIGIHTNDKLSVTAKEESVIIQKLPNEMFPEYYLIRVNEFNQVAKTPLEEWVKYLKTGKESGISAEIISKVTDFSMGEIVEL